MSRTGLGHCAETEALQRLTMRARRSNQSANFSFTPACTEGGPRRNLRLVNRETLGTRWQTTKAVERRNKSGVYRVSFVASLVFSLFETWVGYYAISQWVKIRSEVEYLNDP